MRSVVASHVILAYAQWGWVQMADAEAEAASRPEMQRLVAALRARLWQLQTELREQEVSEASSRAYCRGFCQVGAGQGRAAARGCRPGARRRGWGRGGPGGLPPSRCAPSAAGGKGLPLRGLRGLLRSCRGAARGSRRRALLPSGDVRALPEGRPCGRSAASRGPGPLHRGSRSPLGSGSVSGLDSWQPLGGFLGQAGRTAFSQCSLGSVPRSPLFCSLLASGSKLCSTLVEICRGISDACWFVKACSSLKSLNEHLCSSDLV